VADPGTLTAEALAEALARAREETLADALLKLGYKGRADLRRVLDATEAVAAHG
jgi:hypothetical protein